MGTLGKCFWFSFNKPFPREKPIGLCLGSPQPQPQAPALGVGSPHPGREADLGLYGLSEVSTHCQLGQGLPSIWTWNLLPAKWAIVSPASTCIRAIGMKAFWPREGESWVTQEVRYSRGLGRCWGTGQKKAQRRGRGDSSGVESEGEG